MTDVSPPPAADSSRVDHDLPADADRRRIGDELARLVEGEVRFARHDRMLYATDASIYQVEPIGVVIPKTAADVQAVVQYCAGNRLPILPRGGGTSLAGQAVNAAVVVDFSPHCHALVEVDAARRIARAQPGLVLDHLNRDVAAHGLMFGPDVATSTHATLGGMIGNNSSGARSILYGRTVDNLLALDVLLADGTALTLEEGAAQHDERVRKLTERVAEVVTSLEDEIERRYPQTLRRVNGYNLDLMLAQLRASSPGTFDRVNLAHLFCGAEGTLGVVVEAALKLVPLPKHSGLAIVGFADVDAALRSVLPILESRPAAVELVDDVIISLARDNIEYRRYLHLLPRSSEGGIGAVLYVEYFADQEAEILRRLAWLENRFGSSVVRRHLDPDSMAKAWKLRKAGEPLLYGRPGSRKPVTFIEDTAVDPEHLPEYISRFRKIVDAHDTVAAYYAHASVGCLHIRPLISLKDPADRARMEEIAAQATDLVMEFGGALSGEHGDGRLRSPLLERFYGKSICDGFRRIKAIFDPEHRMNPGNIIASTRMTDCLRVKPAQRLLDVPRVETYFRYERERGLGAAVELCNGAGVCRKTDDGAMCPSYRATRDERHSTRGRGNALRLAITGQLSPDGSAPAWNDPETLETLDLCLSCKACKAECPSNVDLAKLKAEYLAQSHRQAGGAPLRDRVFGHVRRLNRIGSFMPGITNALVRIGPLRAMLNRVLGLDPRRTLPPFAPSLYRWYRSRPSPASSEAPTVVLLPDCFTVYNEPHVGRAAILTLEALGYRVLLPKLGCCGRALISNGLLADAVKTCRETADALWACAQHAVAVVGCEPSCVAAITDDWLDLNMDVDPNRLGRLAEMSMLVEDFIETRWDSHPRRPTLRPTPRGRSILLHGHCHQNALWGLTSVERLLRRTTDAAVNVVDAGCCGLAGAFGYTREHYELSMRIAELSLLPRLRADEDAVVLASGTSCRHQIRDALHREVMHPVEWIAQALDLNLDRR